MADGFYTKLRREIRRNPHGQRTKASMKWMRQSFKNIKQINRRGLLKTKTAFKQVKQPKIGRMYMYYYDAKTKETLPYYDQFPLIFLVAPAEGGWTGLNMHYLPPVLRAKLFDKLLEFTNNDDFDETTKLRLSYDILKSASKLREFAPCFKRYLSEHVASQMVEVPAAEWENVMFLPTDSFIGSKRGSVWQASRNSLR